MHGYASRHHRCHAFRMLSRQISGPAKVNPHFVHQHWVMQHGWAPHLHHMLSPQQTLMRAELTAGLPFASQFTLCRSWIDACAKANSWVAPDTKHIVPIQPQIFSGEEIVIAIDDFQEAAAKDMETAILRHGGTVINDFRKCSVLICLYRNSSVHAAARDSGCKVRTYFWLYDCIEATRQAT